jgi:hypothetical protein
MKLDTKIAESAKLLQTIKNRIASLEQVLRETDDWEDLVYRFYHESFKVYMAQAYTERIVAELQLLAPHLPLNAWFVEIVRRGTGHDLAVEDNATWLPITRPMIEAFAHARYFLTMACKYGKELDEPPNPMPSGWAALLYLYNLR